MIKNYLHKLRNISSYVYDQLTTNHKNHFTHKNHFLDFDIQYTNGSKYHFTKATTHAYCHNVIVYRCVNLIANAASHVPWYLKTRKNMSYERLQYHSILDLLQRPNYRTSGADFFSELIINKLLIGNVFILATGVKNMPPKELYLIDSSDIKVLERAGQVIGYNYPHNSNNFYEINNKNKCPILHIKNYNPFSKKTGMSCLEAATMPIELYNQVVQWNYSLLKNGARPSGALILKDSNSYLTEEQFDRLREQLMHKYASASNSGTPLLLEGGLDWKEMSINPKDMDFLESKNSAAREIALAFGVPPQLLGINGDNTYSNMQEARLALWEETLIPLLDRIADALTGWMSMLFEENIIIDFDRDCISALTEKRENLWSKISTANFMTINEKRNIVSLPPIAGGDKLS